jgi:ferredoxin-NADP reductase
MKGQYMRIGGFFRLTRLALVNKKQEHGDIYTFRFTPKRPIKHIAGQHGLFILPRLGGIHIFSLSSAPEEQYISISTHVRKESAYKQRLNSLKSGEHIILWGPVLDFIFRDNATDYIFLAQGIGITPFRSLLVHADSAKLPISTTLIHVEGGEHTFQELTSGLATHAYYPSDPEGFTQNIQDTLNNNALYYLSGSPRFVRATKKTLRSLGLKRSQMKSDSFLGY